MESSKGSGAPFKQKQAVWSSLTRRCVPELRTKWGRGVTGGGQNTDVPTGLMKGGPSLPRGPSSRR